MEEISLKQARERLGKLHASAAQGHPVKITRNGSYGVVMMSERDYEELVALYRKLDSAKIREILASDDGAGRVFASAAEAFDQLEREVAERDAWRADA